MTSTAIIKFTQLISDGFWSYDCEKSVWILTNWTTLTYKVIDGVDAENLYEQLTICSKDCSRVYCQGNLLIIMSEKDEINTPMK